MNKKRSFVLFSTIILVFIFSILVVKTYEVKSMNSSNIILEYEAIQGKNHLRFLEKYIKSLNNMNSINRIDINDSKYEIYALIDKKDKKYEVDIFVKSYNKDISLHKKISISI